jgi:hypothetical protein
MFKPEDFEIGLEQQLRLRVINDEIDQCDDHDALKTNLKNCTQLIMKYQQMLSSLLREKITKDLKDFTEAAKKLSDK